MLPRRAAEDNAAARAAALAVASAFRPDASLRDVVRAYEKALAGDPFAEDDPDDPEDAAADAKTSAEATREAQREAQGRNFRRRQERRHESKNSIFRSSGYYPRNNKLKRKSRKCEVWCGRETYLPNGAVLLGLLYYTAQYSTVLYVPLPVYRAGSCVYLTKTH